MSNFLSVFEAKALAAALTDAGHSVSERTVQRWKAGVTKPKPQDIQAIHRVIRLAETTKSPTLDQPEWAAAMEERLSDRLNRNRQLIERLIPDEMLQNADALIGRLEERLRLRGEDPPAGSGEQAPGGAGTQVQANGSPLDQSPGQ